MTNKKLQQLVFVLLLAFSLAACGGQDNAQEPTAIVLEEPTSSSAAVDEPVQEPTQEPTLEPEAAVEEPTQEPTQQPEVVEPTAEAAQPTVESVPVANTKLNLNQASGDDYMAAIPGFSSRMVREFQEYRPYISIEQFRREIGKYVSQDIVAGYEEYVYVPVDINESDAATLMQIPGLDAAAAQLLIDGRVYENSGAFLAKLAEVAPNIDQALAATYLNTD